MLKLPYPPSVNHLYCNVPGRGRVRTKQYKEWSELCGWEIKQQRPDPIKGAYALHILVRRPDKRRRDLSNLIKSLEDALVDNGVVEDDSLCQSITIEWDDAPQTIPLRTLLNVYVTKEQVK